MEIDFGEASEAHAVRSSRPSTCQCKMPTSKQPVSHMRPVLYTVAAICMLLFCFSAMSASMDHSAGASFSGERADHRGLSAPRGEINAGDGHGVGQQHPSDGSTSLADARSDEAASSLLHAAVLLVKTATLRVELQADHAATAYVDGVTVLAQSVGGYVAAFNVDSDRTLTHAYGRRQHIGSTTVKVPAQQLDAFLQLLRTGTGSRIIGEELTSEDVSDSFFDMESRVAVLEAAHAQYVRLVSQAVGVSEILAVQAALQPVVQQMELWKGKKKQLDSKIQFATVHIQLSAQTDSAVASPTRWRDLFAPLQTVVECLRILLGLLAACLNVLIFLAVVCVPLAMLLGCAWWTLRSVSQRPLVANWTRSWNLPAAQRAT